MLSSIHIAEGFSSGSAVKNLLATQETWVPSLGQADPLEEDIATNLNILAWKIPWIENPGRLQPTGLQRVGNCRSDLHAYTHMGETQEN